MENQKHREDLSHGIYSEGEIENFRSPSYAQAILISYSEAKKNWGVIEEVTIRCSFFEMQWMHVVFWILDIRVPNSPRANTLQAVSPYGKGLIGLFVLMIGFNSL